MFNLKELEVFTSVMNSHSLTESARVLNLPKSTLSRRLSQLESVLGQPLFRRESNKLIPTEAGQVFSRYAQEILRLANTGHSALDKLQQEVSGQLVVRCHDVLLKSWFGPLMLTFMKEYPGMELRMHTQVQSPGPEQTEGICIWLGQEPDTGLNCERIGFLRQSVYASPVYLAQYGRPSHPQELASHQWIGLSDDTDMRVELKHPQEGRYQPTLTRCHLTVDRLFIQMDAILNGGGLGLVPDWNAGARLKHHPDCLERCLPEWQGPSLGIYLLYPHGSLPKRTHVFINYVRKSLPKGWYD